MFNLPCFSNLLIDFPYNTVVLYCAVSYFSEIVVFLTSTFLPHIHTYQQHHRTSGEVLLDASIHFESQKQKWNVLLLLPLIQSFPLIQSNIQKPQATRVSSIWPLSETWSRECKELFRINGLCYFHNLSLTRPQNKIQSSL